MVTCTPQHYSCQVSSPTGCSQPPFLVQCLLSFYVQHCLSLLAKVLSTQHILSESPAWAVLIETVCPFNAAICKVWACAMSHKSCKPDSHSSSLFFSTSGCFACSPYFPNFLIVFEETFNFSYKALDVFAQTSRTWLAIRNCIVLYRSIYMTSICY